MVKILKKRLEILKSIVTDKNSCKDVSLRSCLESVFQLYGYRKRCLKKNLYVTQEFGHNKVTINGSTVYWPPRVEVSRLVDMYFEIFEDNCHKFDDAGTEIDKGDIVLDAGCCEGYFALKALKEGAKTVYCFEPGRQVSNCLELTFAEAIKNGKIVIKNQLLGDTESKLLFEDNPDDPTLGHIYPLNCSKSENCYTISMTTIDKFCEINQLQQLDYIKVDVEGAELELLKGATKSIAKFSPKIAIATYHRPSHAKQIRELVSSIDPSYKFNLKGLIGINGSVRPVMLHCFK